MFDCFLFFFIKAVATAIGRGGVGESGSDVKKPLRLGSNWLKLAQIGSNPVYRLLYTCRAIKTFYETLLILFVRPGDPMSVAVGAYRLPKRSLCPNAPLNSGPPSVCTKST